MSMDQPSLLDLLQPEPVPPVNLSGLTGFTMRVTDPDELDRIASKWHAAHQGLKGSAWRMFPGWHESHTGSNGHNSAHRSYVYTADLRCKHDPANGPRLVMEALADPCQCVGNDYYRRIYCAGCDWWTDVYDDENIAVEEYLDHCWPGWRDLPVIETSMKPAGGYNFKIPADYPADWQVPGAPVRDCRGETKYGTRHVPAGSPWHGYRAAVTRECSKHLRN